MQSHQPQSKAPVIVLTGGGSGGHITPLLSLAHALKNKNPHCNIVYIGHKGDKFDRQEQRYHDFDFIGFVNGGKFRRYHGESLASLARF
jgi:UDP-N-acetylglucosamine:LPS N-acetylglucosamine transferase